MSKIEALIQKLCPNGVPAVRLGEVCKIMNGKDYKHLSKGDIPVYGSGGIMTYVDAFAYDKPSVLIPRKGSIGNLFYVDKPFWTVDTIYWTKINETLIVPKFLYYLMTTKDLGKLNMAAGVPSLTQSVLYKIEFPLPPVAVQEEVVRILDRFSALEAELEAELEARKKQYEHYRNALLSFNDNSPNVQWLKLGEVFEIRNGYTPSKNNAAFWEGGTIPWFRMEDIRQNGRILSDAIQHITPAAVKGKGLFPANSIIIATTATIGEHALIIADSLANQRFTNLKIRESLIEKLLPKFVFYYMFIIDEWCRKNVNAGNFASVDMKRFKMIDFPLPPLAEQERIVGILDRFETLTTSLQAGLPAEIAARRKQYEHYRDKLLTFKIAN